MSKHAAIWVIVVGIIGSAAAKAEPPVLKSGTPVIYLSDNLDEKDKLGWCIDTIGRGFADTLHAHSCKPARNGPNDTQFSYDSETGQIRSAAFEGKCMSFSGPDSDEPNFGLLDCVAGEGSQKFDYDPESMEFRIDGDRNLCVAVAHASNAAGPFMSRGLISANCAAIESRFKQWVVKE